MADCAKARDSGGSTFEQEYYDKYDYYNLNEAEYGGGSRKGRSKKEASEHTNRHSPAGHERKLAAKLQQSERKRKEK
ncbi:nuclear protein 1b [Mobula hypostoma]|uniref:nuclear protein 1b n=1 Tax=Mobula hypostoma TaxID=723540 RepID=UPI002FC37672